MWKFRHETLICLSGALWLIVGLSLLPFGLNLIVSAAMESETVTQYPILQSLSTIAGGAQYSALILIAICLAVGYVKMRFVLSKTVQRVVGRIRTLPNPAPLKSLYTPGYFFLILGMMMLGMAMKWLDVVSDIRGAIDVAVGAALINGAILYFRMAFTSSSETA